MALDPNSLKQQLLNLFNSKADTYDAAAQAWVDAYSAYAAVGQAFGITPTLLPVSKTAMKSVLLAQFIDISPSPTKAATVASSIATALTAFWLSPPVQFSLPAIFVTAVTGTPILTTALQTVFASVLSTDTPDIKATQLSSAMDIFTKTVTVTNFVPPVPVITTLI